MEAKRLIIFLVISYQIVTNEAIGIWNNTEPSVNVNFTHICTDLLRNSLFEPEFVVDTPWRVFYTFNMKLQASTTCLDMSFQLATPEIIERIKADMLDYVEYQPTWQAATLLLKIGADNEVLLVADQGPAGKFVGVPNMMRKSVVNLMPSRRNVPLLNYVMKLIRGGRYLLVMDCNVGVATLSGHAGKHLDLKQVTPVLKELQTSLGLGDRVCNDQKSLKELFPVVLNEYLEKNR